jgi:hypothetical protein
MPEKRLKTTPQHNQTMQKLCYADQVSALKNSENNPEWSFSLFLLKNNEENEFTQASKYDPSQHDTESKN